MNTVYRNIEAERVRAGLTQIDLSKELGISPQTYRRYLKGNPIPSKILTKLSNKFACSVDYLLKN